MARVFPSIVACRILCGVVSYPVHRRAMAECGMKALSVLEAARSRYESLQISDDVFGESGDDSSDNPFYSTSGDSNSDNCCLEAGDDQRAGETGNCQNGGPPGSISTTQAEEDGWSDTLQDITVAPYNDTYGMSFQE